MSLTSIVLHSYAKNLLKYTKKEKIGSLIILTVCLLKVVRMTFLLYKSVSYTFWKQNKTGNRNRIENMQFTVEIPKLHSIEKNIGNSMMDIRQTILI